MNSKPVRLDEIRLVSLETRANRVSSLQFAGIASTGGSFRDFFDSLPRFLGANTLRQVVSEMAKAHRRRKPVILGMGAHVIKVGLSPIVLDWVKRGIVTALALNGAGAIHDCEIALIGQTSEDVAMGLEDGSFGMVRETGEIVNGALRAAGPDDGMGMLLGQALLRLGPPFVHQSLLANAAKLHVPVTVHVAIGTDIVHMHPNADGAAIGRASHADFRLLSSLLMEMGGGGVYLNVGSAVLLPEVFLKAFTVAQNLGANLRDFTTVNMDMISHYRPLQNVVSRPPGVGGRGYALIGHHEIMLPLIAWALNDMLDDEPPPEEIDRASTDEG